MGYEYRVRFETSARALTYAPDEFLLRLPKTLTSLECTEADGDEGTRYEYRQRDLPDPDGWPLVVITVDVDGFFVLEYDRPVGTMMLGHIVKYALDFAKDGVKIEEA